MAKVRYLFDEHMSRPVVRALRQHGIDVLTASEAGLLAAPDTEYIAVARETGRVMVTRDRDFQDLHYTLEHHAGIVYYRNGNRPIGEIIEFLVLLYEVVDAEGMVGRLESF